MYIRPATFGQAKIIGGEPNPDPSILPISEDQIRAIGAFTKDGRPFCTGTLIAPRVVLTAAHCEIPVGVWFQSGRDVDSPETEARVSAAVVHPNYRRGNPGFDFTLVYLDRDLSAHPIEPGAPPSVGASIQTAGYGRTDINVIGNTERRWLVEQVVGVDPTEFSIERHGPYGQCMGDSGGPALRMAGGEARIIGVVSHGDPECTGIDVYERADSVQGWMDSVMNGWRNAPPPPPPARSAAVGWLLGLLVLGVGVGMIVRKGR